MAAQSHNYIILRELWNAECRSSDPVSSEQVFTSPKVKTGKFIPVYFLYDYTVHPQLKT